MPCSWIDEDGNADGDEDGRRGGTSETRRHGQRFVVHNPVLCWTLGRKGPLDVRCAYEEAGGEGRHDSDLEQLARTRAGAEPDK